MFRSLRWRIQFWHAIILGVVIFVFAAAMYLQQRHTRYHTIDSELAAAVEVLVGKLESAPPSELQALLTQTDSSQSAGNLIDDLDVPNTFGPRRYRFESEAPYFTIWNSASTEVRRSSKDTTVPPPSTTAADLTLRRQRFRQRNEFREAWSSGPSGSVVLVGRFIKPDRRDLRDLLFLLLGAGVVVFGLGLAGGWFLSRDSVRPIQHISQVASEISEKNLADRIDTTEMDLELGQLSQTLNATFGRLEKAFSQQAQFTADASHELRTPLAVIKMHQELALSKDRPAAEYRDALETCQRATTRMTALVESLMALAKLDANNLDPDQNPSLSRIDISSIVVAATEDTALLAAAKQITVNTNLTSAFVNGDAARLNQVFTNLLANAVAYSPNSSKIDISISTDDDNVTIEFADTGDGIPADDLPHIFDRFYRVQKERSRDTGGSGLGLSICQTIVEAHLGTLTAESESKTGSTFRVRLPLQE